MPFLLAALLIDRFIVVLQRFRGAMQWTSRIAGALLVAAGVLMVTDLMRAVTAWLSGLTPEMLKARL